VRAAVKREPGAQALKWSLFEQRVEGGADRRASLPQRFVTLAQPLVRLQTREESLLPVFVELIVDQGDKIRVVVGHQRVNPLLFQFRQRRSRGGESAHDRPDRDGQRRRRFCVTVAFGVDKQDGFALRLGFGWI
jgi:hypothetical protein